MVAMLGSSNFQTAMCRSERSHLARPTTWLSQVASDAPQPLFSDDPVCHDGAGMPKTPDAPAPLLPPVAVPSAHITSH
jgi:hypothetical protein